MARVKVDRGDAHYNWIDYDIFTHSTEVLYRVKPSKRVEEIEAELDIHRGHTIWGNNLIGVLLL